MDNIIKDYGGWVSVTEYENLLGQNKLQKWENIIH